MWPKDLRPWIGFFLLAVYGKVRWTGGRKGWSSGACEVSLYIINAFVGRIPDSGLVEFGCVQILLVKSQSAETVIRRT